MKIKKIIKSILKNSIKLILKFHKPFYIVMVDGGLGSQIFKFALGTCLSEKTGAKIYYDLSWFRENGMDIQNKFTRKYEIENVFPDVKMNEPSRLLLKLTKFCNTYTTKYPHIYDETLFNLKNVYLDSYFANIQYFYDVRESLISKLQFSKTFNKYKLTENNSVNTVAVHIRQGDYINSIHDVTTPEYFAEGIKLLNDKFNGDCFFNIFCTAKKYFEDNVLPLIHFPIKYQIISGTDDKGAVDMYLMSKCRHFIISNSSFSLFPAWVNRQNGIVIMPSKWHRLMDSNMTKDSANAFILKDAIVINL